MKPLLLAATTVVVLAATNLAPATAQAGQLRLSAVLNFGSAPWWDALLITA